MKIYKHTLFPDNSVNTTGIEVIKETPKTYKTRWNIFKKSEIDVLKSGFYMFSLSPDPRVLLEVALKREEDEIGYYERWVAKHKEKAEQLRKRIAEAESEAEQ